jgi:hypothetical protein
MELSLKQWSTSIKNIMNILKINTKKRIIFSNIEISFTRYLKSSTKSATKIW